MISFETSDLYLATALKIKGFRLIDIRTNGTRRGVFVFEDRADRPQLVIDYYNGNLSGSLKQFSNIWSDLKAYVQQEMEHRNGKFR